MRSTSSVLPVASSPLVDALVQGPPRPATVLAAFPTALYLLAGTHEQVVPVLTSDALRLPTGVCLTHHSRDVEWGVQAGDHVHIGSGRILLPYAALRAVRTWRPSRVGSHTATVPRPSGLGPSPVEWPPPASTPLGPPPVEWPPPASTPLSPTPVEWPLFGSQGFPAPGALRDQCADMATAALAGRPVRELVTGLVGAGPGLTPSGDDALCGVLLTLRTFESAADPLDAASVSRDGTRRTGLSSVTEAVRDLTGRTTSLSASLLLAAAQGYAVPQVVHLIDLISSAGPPVSDPALQQALTEVLEIGHSSGHDLLAGIAGALDALRTHNAHPPLALQGDHHG